MKKKTTAGVGPASTGKRKRGGRRSIDMLHGPLAGKILLFALPLAITGILQTSRSSDIMSAVTPWPPSGATPR